MGAIFSKPKAPPPPPPPPTPPPPPPPPEENIEVGKAEAEELKAAGSRRGRASTIATGKAGLLQDDTETTGTIKLLGG